MDPSCHCCQGREDIQWPMMPKQMPVPEEDQNTFPIPVKLLVDNTSQQILFAEVGKDIVDFLCDLVNLPLGQALELLPQDQPVNTSNLEKLKISLSILAMDGSYLAPHRVGENNIENMMKNMFHGYGCYEVVEEGGYSNGTKTYMVMDDLVVEPMSAISVIRILDSLDVTDLRGIEEKVVYFGEDEAMKLMKESMISDQVLTNVFME